MPRALVPPVPNGIVESGEGAATVEEAVPVATRVGVRTDDLTRVVDPERTLINAQGSELCTSGGNSTGVSFLSLDLSVKRVDLLKEAKPTMTRVAVLSIAAFSAGLFGPTLGGRIESGKLVARVRFSRAS
jgi:hypothetical protein